MNYHELTHAYIHSYASSQTNNYTEEQVCDLVSNSFFIIKEIVFKYFNIENTRINNDFLKNL